MGKVFTQFFFLYIHCKCIFILILHYKYFVEQGSAKKKKKLEKFIFTSHPSKRIFAINKACCRVEGERERVNISFVTQSGEWIGMDGLVVREKFYN